MSKTVYTIKGDFQMGRLRQKYSLQVVGVDDADARERAYTDFGSRHGVKRTQVTIESVTKTAKGDIDPIRAKQAL